MKRPNREPDIIVPANRCDDILEIWIDEGIEYHIQDIEQKEGYLASIKRVDGKWGWFKSGRDFEPYSDTIFSKTDEMIEEFLIEELLLGTSGG